jgi:hypothetical protein
MTHHDSPQPLQLPLRLNFFPAFFSATTASVWIGRWENQDAASQLEDQIPGLKTWRDTTDGTRLIAWHPTLSLERSVPGCRAATFAIDELPQFFERLVNDAVRARFYQLGFTEKSRGFVNYGRSLLTQIQALESTSNEPIGIFSFKDSY